MLTFIKLAPRQIAIKVAGTVVGTIDRDDQGLWHVETEQGRQASFHYAKDAKHYAHCTLGTV